MAQGGFVPEVSLCEVGRDRSVWSLRRANDCGWPELPTAEIFPTRGSNIALSTQGGSRTLTFLSYPRNGAEVVVVVGESGDRAERPKKPTRSLFAENQREIGPILG